MSVSQKNIVLIGFMAAGKSLVSESLSRKLNYSIVSTDELIVAREGKSITDIFADQGEAYFRSVEKQVVDEVSQQQGLIIDCGGGVIKDEDNMAALKRNGSVFWLTVDPEISLKRVHKQGGTRPLLNDPDPLSKINALLAERTPFYEAAADYIIDSNDDDIEIASNEIIEILKSKF